MENELVRAIIDRKIRESLMAQQAQHSNSNILDRIKGIGNRLDNVGGGFSSVGDYLSNNTALSGLGAKSQAIGGTLQNGASAIQNAINSVAGGVGASALSSGAGASASGAVGGAAMSNPITAIAALGAMALTGANRHRAEKTGQQTEQLAYNSMENAQNNLSQIPQTVLTPDIVSSPQTLPNLQEVQTNQNAIIPQSDGDIKKSAFSGIAKGLDEFLTGYRENKTQGFDWNNLQKDDTKSKMQRFGEGIGTVARLSQNPIVQGLVAGGLSGIFSGDPLYGLSSGYKYANSKYKANLYKDILAQQGINVGNNNGIIDALDLIKTLTAFKLQKDYITRGEYDKLRVGTGQIDFDEYNSIIHEPRYHANDVVNLKDLKTLINAIGI